MIDEKKAFETGQINCAVVYKRLHGKRICRGDKRTGLFKSDGACIGKQTKAAADSPGMKTYMSEKATIDSVVEWWRLKKGANKDHGTDNNRPRRLRRNETLRKMVRETRMDKSSLIYPIFVVEGENKEEEIPPCRDSTDTASTALPYALEGAFQCRRRQCDVLWHSGRKGRGGQRCV